jgi:NADP-dependent 3-hydroxy acid dehydrogenase YdfG
MIITGNKDKGLANSLFKIYPDATFCSRATGFDLTDRNTQQQFSKMCLDHRIIVNCAALWRFEQTNLLERIYKTCVENNHNPHIICVGSTTDRVKNGKPWLYNAEKKALRDYSNTLALGGVWDLFPKVSYISFGTLSNNQEKHPDRKTLDIDEAAQYIKWLIDQPSYVNINEVSIDPMQDSFWNNRTP